MRQSIALRLGRGAAILIEVSNMIKQEGHWKRLLAGAPQLHGLPLDRPRQARVGAAARLGSGIPAKTLAALEQLCRREKVSLLAGLDACLVLLVARYSGERDIVTATPAGDDAGMLLVRSDLTEAAGFRALLAQVNRGLKKARAQEPLSGADLLELLGNGGCNGNEPFVQLVSVLRRQPLADAAPVPTDHELAVVLTRTAEDGLALEWSYAAGIFDASTIERMDRHLNMLLKAVCETPDEDLWSLPLLDERERRLLMKWSGSAAPFEERCLHELVAAQARRTPDAIAVAAGDETLTYAALNERANRLAHHLRALGVGAHDLIGVCVERSISMVVGLLAILKAGGAYVPLDPRYPPERLGFMLEDSKAALVLTQASTRAAVGGARQVVLDDPQLAASLAACAPEDPASLPSHGPDSLAYLIYTSGSTGRPKGVCIEHRNAAALIGWALRAYKKSVLAGVLASTSICFDLSVFELFVPLCGGGRTIIVANALDFEAIARAEGLTLINTVPSAIKVLVEERRVPAGVEVINLAGEPLAESLVRDIYRHTQVQAVYNLYGPSEDTTYSTWALIDRDARGAPPIGRPLPNGRAYVLDAKGQLAPVGVVGELYLGGARVSRGYWNRPELTAGRFSTDPFHPGQNTRLYRTGDLVRWSARGELEFLGRADHQIKLRGFRIELGEIQAQLLAQESVRDGLVMARRDERGEQQLVAYVVPRTPAEPADKLVDECRAQLRKGLPEYMIPVAFVVLDALPLTPNGKVDRAALPAPALVAPAEHIPPASPVEEQLVLLWQELLQVQDRLGVTASFFELGGNSLLAMRLLSRVQARFGTAVSLDVFLSAPTVRALAQVIAEGHARTLPPVAAAPRGRGLPLSFPQQRIWFLHQLDTGSEDYHLPLRFRLEGPLDIDALRAALRTVFERHESLRTVVRVNGGHAEQWIAGEVEEPLQLVDLGALAEDARLLELQRIADRLARAPFDLEHDPMLRAACVRLGPERHELLLTLHHIAADGWSLTLLLEEIGALYRASLEGTVPSLRALAVQYADYALWQREHIKGELLETHAQYWIGQLAGAPSVHGLPLDHPRPAQPSLAGAIHRSRVDAAMLGGLEGLGRRSGATLFMVLHAAFALLLARHGAGHDIVIGTPVANRETPELEPLIGVLVDTLALRTQVSRDMSFLDLLAHSRSTVLDALRHQQLPFELLVERLQPERSLSHAPVVQVMLALQENWQGRLALPGINTIPQACQTQNVPCELTLQITPVGAGLEVEWIYRRELFEAATIERLAAHFTQLLQAAVAQPQANVWALPLLAQEERELLLKLSAGRSEPRPDLCVHELFEAQALRTPDAAAIECHGERISYAELDRRANRCAHHLRSQGVVPQTVIAVLCSRSVDMAVAMLAALKAGCLYLPLDVNLPRARIEAMLRDSRAPIVLTQRQWLAIVAAMPGVVPVPLDEPGVLEGMPEDCLPAGPARVTPESLAYLIYTSGSSGEPKGVMNTHAGLVNLCHWHARSFGTGPQSRCTLLTSLGFDAAVWELWSALLSGACAVPVSDEVRATPHLLAELLREERITHCFLPTGLFEVLSEGDTLLGGHLQVLLCGGDRLQHHRLPAGSQARLVNCYGPTEATVVTTSYEVPREGVPLIGRPIDNVQAYVLNDALQLQPDGVPGELYIAGVSLARGYWNADELSRERFIPNPFSTDRGARLYKTGDFVRRMAGGNLEFIGRRDQQVKLRGFRIELGEIEHRLGALPEVQSAVVMVREDVPGLKRLVGYITLPAGATATATQAAITASLRRELPEYMVPSCLVVLDELPLTPNGKVDRARLPAPIADLTAGLGESRLSPAELGLQRIWSELLERAAPGIDTNFFAAGGHSLLVTRMIHAIADQLQARVTVQDVFRNPTIRGLAAVVERSGRLEAAAELPAPGVPFDLSLCQFRVWYVEQMRGVTNEHNMPLAMTLRGTVDPQLLEEALNEVIARHDMLRTGFILEGAKPMQRVVPSLRLTLQWHDLSALPLSQIARQEQELATRLARQPFDIARPPLMSALLIRNGEAEYRLQLNFHHLILDGWSFTLLFEELLRAYERLAGAQSAAPPPAAPARVYAGFVEWQRRWLQGEEARQQCEFWRQYLHGCSEEISLPGQSEWAGGERHVNYLSAHVESRTQLRLSALAREHEGTLFGVLYSTFALLLGRLSGQSDINIGIPVNGRHIGLTQGVIGNFINSLPVRNQFDLQQTFSAYLRDQIGNLAQVLSNQDYPFEKIIEIASQSRRNTATPLFQVFFNMLSLPRRASSPLFEVVTEQAAELEPKFGLTLYVEEGDNGIDLGCHFNPEQFSPAAVTHLLRQYVLLLQQICADPGLRCGDYSLAPENAAEGRRLEPRRCWIGSVQEIFRRQAMEAPDAQAIIEPGQEWTYRELLDASARLALSLQAQGVGRGDVVGIVAARRGCLVAAVLATLQVGAAFSLLNPEYPLERVRLLAELIKPAALLFAGDPPAFEPKLLERLQDLAPCRHVPAAKPAGGLPPVNFSPVQVEPGDTACITFTSGTTGIPKVVAGVHIGIAGYLEWAPQWLEVSATDRFSLLSGLGHDPLQREIFGALCAGATLVIPQQEVIAPQVLAAWMKTHAITFAHLTPALARILCTERTSLPSLRVAFVTGEKLHSDTVAELLRCNDRMRVLNSYGTTETQRAVTYFEASAARDHHGVVPAAESAPDTVLRVLNTNGTPCGLGEVGDLYLESHAISRGYRNDPQLTARLFADLPDGRRRYRTGDLGCRLPEGRVLVLGRRDGQINIRGLRVEPGEIESHSRSVEGVKDAVVLPVERSGGEPAIVAYIVPQAPATNERSLRTRVLAHLRAVLPAYMVPASVMLLNQLPLTPNGKLDVRGLPAPRWTEDHEHVAPRTRLERELTAIWAETLRVERIGVDDDFFTLGGHSMLMILLLSELRKKLGRQFEISQILRCTTIRQQAEVLARLQESVEV